MTDPTSHRNDAMARMRTAQDRSFDCEGIPMFLALVGGAGGAPRESPQQPGGAMDEGRRLAGELDELRAALFPTRRESDMGCLVSTIQALTVGTFEPGGAL